MAGAIIRIDQVRPGPVTSSGTAGVARNDLWVGSVVNLVSTATGNGSQSWTFLDKPAGSSATLASSTAVTCTFTPDLPGSYRVQLSTNGGAQVQVRIAAVTKDSSGNTVFRGWRIPAFAERSAEANFSGNTVGWKSALATIFTAIDAALKVITGDDDGFVAVTATRFKHTGQAEHDQDEQQINAYAADDTPVVVIDHLMTADRIYMIRGYLVAWSVTQHEYAYWDIDALFTYVGAGNHPPSGLVTQVTSPGVTQKENQSGTPTLVLDVDTHSIRLTFTGVVSPAMRISGRLLIHEGISVPAL